MKYYLSFLIILLLFSNYCEAQKYKNGTRLLKGAEVLSNTPLQLDYVLENLSDTAKVTSLHEGKTHLVLNDGSGEWHEWWYIKGRWQIKALTTTSTDTLLINNSSKDTLLILSKDTIVRESNYKVNGMDGSLLYLKDSVLVPIPYINMVKGKNSLPWNSYMDFNINIEDGLPFNISYTYNGLTLDATRDNKSVYHHIKDADVMFRVSEEYVNKSDRVSSLSLTPELASLKGEKAKIISDYQLELSVWDTANIDLNRIRLEPDCSHFRLETKHTKFDHPISELYIDRSKLEFRKGKASPFDFSEVTLISPPIFSVGNNFNYLDYLKYNAAEKSFYIKNKIVFTDTENNNVASIFVNATKNDIEFTSNALGGEIISLLEISKIVKSQNGNSFILKDDGDAHLKTSSGTQEVTSIETTPIVYTAKTLFIYGDDIPDPLADNTLYLQLNSAKELWLHVQMNGITKRIKLE